MLLISGFAPAIGAFVFNTTQRERGPRGEIVIGHCVRYLGIGETLRQFLQAKAQVAIGVNPHLQCLRIAPRSPPYFSVFRCRPTLACPRRFAMASMFFPVLF
jgi:hypothetical protein